MGTSDCLSCVLVMKKCIDILCHLLLMKGGINQGPTDNRKVCRGQRRKSCKAFSLSLNLSLPGPTDGMSNHQPCLLVTVHQASKYQTAAGFVVWPPARIKTSKLLHSDMLPFYGVPLQGLSNNCVYKYNFCCCNWWVNTRRGIIWHMEERLREG